MPLENIEITRSIAQLSRVESNGAEAYATFRRCSILEVRKKCLNGMRQHTAAWATAGNLDQLECDLYRMSLHNDQLWEEFMFVCIWALKGNPDSTERMVKLVMSSYTRGKEVLRSRMMRAFLQYREKINFPFISDFLRSEVRAFWDTIELEHSRYRDEDWHRLTRALKTLLEHNDYGCITEVRKIVKKFGDPKFRGPLFSGTGPLDDRLFIVQHRAYLQEALRQMKRAKAIEIECERLTVSEGVPVRPMIP